MVFWEMTVVPLSLFLLSPCLTTTIKSSELKLCVLILGFHCYFIEWKFVKVLLKFITSVEFFVPFSCSISQNVYFFFCKGALKYSKLHFVNLSIIDNKLHFLHMSISSIFSIAFCFYQEWCSEEFSVIPNYLIKLFYEGTHSSWF